MELIICPHCDMRVVVKADGKCPSCQAVLNAQPMEATSHLPTPHFTLSKSKCPGCNAPLPRNAVLCVACGLHLKTGVQLASLTGTRQPESDATIEDSSSVEIPAQSKSANPYASPSINSHANEFPDDDTFRADLTPWGVSAAKSVVGNANAVLMAVLVSLFACQLLGICLLPWYAYQWYRWHSLNRRFAELRHPNSFSAHGVLAANFQDAKPKLIQGALYGALFWIGVGSYVVWQYFTGLAK